MDQEKALKESLHKRILSQWGLEWLDFLRLVIDPWVIILAVISALLVYLASLQKDNTVTIVSSVLVGVFASVLGARIHQRLSENKEGSIVQAVGKNAIRTLKHLYESIFSLEKKVKIDSESTKALPESSSQISARLDELVERCKILQSETLNAIENWSDILPGVNVKAEIESLAEQRFEIEYRRDEIIKLKLQLELSQTEKEEMDKLIDSLEKKLVDLKDDYAKRDSSLATSLSGSSGSTGVSVAAYFDGSGKFGGIYSGAGVSITPSSKDYKGLVIRHSMKCAKCGRNFKVTLPAAEVVRASQTFLCNECINEQKPS